ncbi:MAG TPA: DUF3667 domain-containing protein [Chitinophagaceae bacterium]|nr:DUF3667 domain-containing protein [Chitinophagaceae bacterium]
MSVVCKNCNHSFSKNYKYCPYCGQAATMQRLNFHQVIHDIMHAFIHGDKGVFLLFKELSYMPGRVARLYVEGKRKKYFNPFSFLVLMVAIALFFILKFESFTIPHKNLNSDKLEILHFVFKYFNVFIFIMCPVNAFLIWLFFRKYNLNFIENLVLAAYMSGQTMFFYCIILIPLILFTSIMVAIGTITGILLACWSVMAIMQFYETKSFRNIIKAIFIIIISQTLSQGLTYFSFDIYKKLIY